LVPAVLHLSAQAEALRAPMAQALVLLALAAQALVAQDL